MNPALSWLSFYPPELFTEVTIELPFPEGSADYNVLSQARMKSRRGEDNGGPLLVWTDCRYLGWASPPELASVLLGSGSLGPRPPSLGCSQLLRSQPGKWGQIA